MMLLRTLALISALALAACGPPAGPALWRVTDADSEIFLFGTVHVLPRDVDWRTARVRAAFDEAETVVFEADVQSDPAALQALVRQLGALPPGDTLSAQLDVETRARLSHVSAQVGVPEAGLQTLRPWLVALQLTLAAAVREGGDPSAGVESVLTAEARAAGKRIVFLETSESQVRALAGLSPEAQRAFLDASLTEIEDGKSSLQPLYRAWLRGDLGALNRMANEEMEAASPEIHEALITKRNRAWADQIAEILAGEGDVFIAVGAAHLVGDESVALLLRERGIAVEGP